MNWLAVAHDKAAAGRLSAPRTPIRPFGKGGRGAKDRDMNDNGNKPGGGTLGEGGGEPFLVVRNLTKMFGQFTALKDISLDIYQGEFVCFLGPSGCGKTTLLRAIAGLDIQTSDCS